MPHAPFVHLRLQSAFSMLEGAMQPADIAAACRKLGMPAAGLTDRNVMFGAMEFSDAMMAAGIQPIIGSLIAIERPGSATLGGRAVQDWLVLLAQNEAGYGNLIHLVSRAHLDPAPHEGPHLKLDMLDGRTGGLIALTAGPEGALARLLAEEQREAAGAYLSRLEGLFPGRLYIELSRTGHEVEARAEDALIDLAYARGLPLVATNPVAFAGEDFHAAHDVMLCIADSAYVESPDRRRSNRHHHLKSAEAMAELFADIPEAIASTLAVARRCAVKAPSRDPILPSLAGDRAGEAAMLAARARAGLDARLKATVLEEGEGEDVRAQKVKPYLDRLDYEIDIINKMGFAGYFLIVADFIQWAKTNGIPVGPGRGSGAGSLVAWALTITDLDPLRLNLLFERFLNPERVSMPDFDIDFCETRREEVIRYVQARYGRDQVAQIITFGKLKARAVLKDVGRVLQMPYGQVDRLAKLIPNHPSDPWTLDRAVNGVAELATERRNDPAVARLLDLAMKLEGFPRHASTHAAGVVIGDRPLDQLVPLYRDPRSDMPVTQFDMKWVEKAGLVKFDFLGLKTLSVLQRAVELLAKRGITVDLSRIPWDDEETFALLARGETVGVFQLESEGMRRTLSLVKPDCFEDIIALVALYRPGPMDNIPSFANRKHGHEQPDYLHPWLEEILKETYGVIIYQEQVMQIAQVLAGYSLGEADLLRRAMGKKKKEEMDAQKARFLEGAAAKGVDTAQADYIFELVAKFAGYGFNKSHAAAYALVAYQTAWLKAKYPVEFYAASMAYDIALTDKLAIFMDDMRRLGVKCLPPCVNASQADFSVEPYQGPDSKHDHAVRYALAALKGVGEKAMEALVVVREARGPFASLADFAARIDPKLLNKRQLESLAAAGAFDALDRNRAGVHGLVEGMLANASAVAEARNSLQGGLFGEASELTLTLFAAAPATGWTLAEAMAHEKEAFGFFFSAHPLDSWRHLLDAYGVRSFAAICGEGRPLDGRDRSSCMMAGLIEEARWRTPSGSNRRYLLVNLSDASGQYLASCFDEETQESVERLAAENVAVLVSAELLWRDGEEAPRVTLRAVTPLDQLASRMRSRLVVEVASEEAISDLCPILERCRGGRGEVHARLRLPGGRYARIALGQDFAVDADVKAMVERLRGVRGAELTAADRTMRQVA